MTDSSDYMGAKKMPASDMTGQNGLLRNRLEAMSSSGQEDYRSSGHAGGFAEPSEGIEEAFLALIQSNERGSDLSSISPQFNSAKRPEAGIVPSGFQSHSAPNYGTQQPNDRSFMSQNGAQFGSFGMHHDHDPFDQPAPPEAIFADREPLQPLHHSPFSMGAQNQAAQNTARFETKGNSHSSGQNASGQLQSYQSPFAGHQTQSQPHYNAQNLNQRSPEYPIGDFHPVQDQGSHLKSFKEEQQQSYYGDPREQSGMGYASETSRGTDYSQGNYAMDNQNNQSQYYPPTVIPSQPYQDSGAFESRALEVVHDDAGYVSQSSLIYANHEGFDNGAEESYADPEFQALVQWSHSDVDHSRHNNGGHDMPNFLAYRQERGSKFNAKTVLLTTVACTAVMGLVYFAYQAGQQKFVDVTPKSQDSSETRLASNERDQRAGSQNSRNFGAPDKAQSRPQQVLQVQPQILEFVVEDVSGTAGNIVPMNIRLVGTNLRNDTMLLFRNIPEKLKLSKGSKRDGVWSITAADLSQLALVIPQDYKGGSFDFEVFAFPTQDTKQPERRLAKASVERVEPAKVEIPSQQTQTQQQDVSFTNAQSEQQGPQIAQLPPSNVTETDPVNNQASLGSNSMQTDPASQGGVEEPQQRSSSSLSSDAEAKSMRRANGLLRDGDVAGARLLFEHLATQGSMKGAFSLALTYDEDYLRKIVVKGLKADMNMAVKWYKEAAKMGHQDAKSRLNQLGQ